MSNVEQQPLGRFLEDFEVDAVYLHGVGRTISEADNTWFTLLTCNTHPVHFNAQYGSATEFGRCLVNSTLTLAVVAGMTVDDLSQNALANLGWKSIALPAPVFAGDTLYAESRVLSKRESRSRPAAGVVEVRTLGRKQDGTVVIAFERSFMVYRRGHAPSDELTAMRADWISENPFGD